MTYRATLDRAARAWPGVTACARQFGGAKQRPGKRESGHQHDDPGFMVIPLRRKVRDEVVAAGLAEPQHVLPDPGRVSKWLRCPDDVVEAIRLPERSDEPARA